MSQINPLNILLNTILDNKEIILFLGGGASVEGKKDEGPFPNSEELIDRVLDKYNVIPKNDKERLNYFYEIISRWEEEDKLPVRLREFLEGKPGLAHYQLAALSIALLEKCSALLYLTKNHDELIENAFRNLKKSDVIVVPFSQNMAGSECQSTFSYIEGHLKEGRPVIVKLFGTIDSKKPIINTSDIKFEREIENILIEWMKKPMLVIGYSFSDKIMEELFGSSRGSAPVFIVNPSKKIPISLKGNKRVHHIKSNFSDFITELTELVQERIPGINKKIDKILEFLDPTLLYPDFNSIQNRVKKCSKISLIRAEEKIPKIELDGKIRKLVPIPRKDTSPDFERFVKGDRPFMVVIGDSGSGKSTLLYRVAINELNQEFITLFYDVHYIQGSGSFIERICQDFRCNKIQLESVFEHFDKILKKENQKLLIIIDGLNEITKPDPLLLKDEIEGLGSQLPQSIKILYSCRTVYWNSYIKMDAPISTSLYHDSKEFILFYYSEEETLLAFEAYKEIYEFHGDFGSLKSEFKQKIRDPLMLRMLAEGYQKEKLPDFAPAVKIFRTYEEMLKRKFKHNAALKDFIYELISFKLEETNKEREVSDQFIARKIRTDNRFSSLLQLIKPKDPFVLLEDEGILSLLEEDEDTYRFTYDRFFEYLLGKEIGEQFKRLSAEGFVETLCRKIIDFQKIHFSFLQALKSEIIRLNIDNSKGIWSFYNSKTLRKLLNNSDVTIVNFTKEVLRELTFEAEKDTFEVLQEITENEIDWKLLALDIAGDSPKIKAIIIGGLFSDDKGLIKRSMERLGELNKNLIFREETENIMIDLINMNIKITPSQIRGFLYYSVIIFNLEEKLGNDPFVNLKSFWRRILSQINKISIYEVKFLFKKIFIEIIREESIPFLGNKFAKDGIEYVWEKMTHDIRQAALELVPLLINSHNEIGSKAIEAIKFFGSDILSWEDREKPQKAMNYTYELENRFSKWILIKHSEVNFDKVVDLLDDLVQSKYWLNIDFSINVMKTILTLIHGKNKQIVNIGYEALKKWTLIYERETSQFYLVLNEKDPFSINFVPIEPLAKIESMHFTPISGPIPVLSEWLLSGNLKKELLGLLCTRYLWKDYPQKVLETLGLIVHSENILTKNWLERILKEIYNVYPGMVEEFFEKNFFNPKNVHSIKYREFITNEPEFRYKTSHFYKELFMRGADKRIILSKWYQKMLQSKSLELFCSDLVDEIFTELEIYDNEF